MNDAHFMRAALTLARRGLGEFFNVSPVFRRLGEWTDLPSEAEAMLYLVAKWPARSSNGRGRVLSTALNFLGLPSFPAAPDMYNSDLFKPTEGAELLDHFFFCTWPLLYDQRISIMPEFVVHWSLCRIRQGPRQNGPRRREVSLRSPPVVPRRNRGTFRSRRQPRRPSEESRAQCR